MIDPGVLYDKLSNFETADDLADYFKSVQIQAIPGEPETCAIAAYFHNETGKYIHVDGETITIYNGSNFDVAELETVFDCTESMKEFVKKFDQLVYPDLILPGYDGRCMCCCTDCED